MEPEPQSTLRWWEKPFALDLRSLALLRIGLGFFVVLDTLQRLTQAHIFLSAQGVTPRRYAAEAANHWHWSLNMVSDALWWQVLLLVVLLAAGLALAAGYRTGWATAVAWVLTLSVQSRNEAILDGGDAVQRLLLFWSMFVPLGAAWSIDALRQPPPARLAVATPGAAALKVQMLSIFFFAALLKSGDPWRKDFNATWYALQWDYFITDIGVWFRQFPELLRWFTKATLVIEFAGPLLVLVPVAPLQVIALSSHIALHLGFMTCMYLGMFSGVMISGWMGLMPGWLWEKLRFHGAAPPCWWARLLNWSASLLPAPVPRPAWFVRHARLATIAVSALAIYVFAWNVRGLDFDRFVRFFPSQLNPPALTLRLEQQWSMFAPYPTREDGWFVIPAKLANGTTVDLFKDGAPLSWDRPASISDAYRDRRWRRYYWMVTGKANTLLRRYYAEYLCRDWDRRHDEVLNTFEIILMYEVSNPDLTVSPPRKMSLWEHKCN